jgi:RNA polymerase primary sigma factor
LNSSKDSMQAAADHGGRWIPMSERRPSSASESLTVEEQTDLLLRWRTGDAVAGDLLAKAYRALVDGFARKWWREPLQFVDLVQEGSLALIEALSRYDGSKPLTPYVIGWVEGRVKRHVQNFVGPVSLTDDAARAAFFDDPGSRPKATPLDEVEESLLAYGTEDDSFESLMAWKRRDAVDRCLDVLSEKECDVVRRRALAEDPETLAEIGFSRGMRPQSVYCLEMRAMAKLRHAAVSMFGIRLEWLV